MPQDKTTNDADAKIESGKSHAKSAADEISAAAHDLKDAAGAKAQEFRAAAEEKASEFKHRAEDAVTEARERAKTFQSDGERYVRENPIQAVLSAFAAGFVIGLILRR